MDLLGFARAKIPFYRSASVDWAALPVVERKQYVERPSEFCSEMEDEESVYDLTSSGTTGPALKVVLDDDAWSAVNFRFFEHVRIAAGLDGKLFQRGRPGVLFVSNKPGRPSFVRVLPSLAQSLYVRMQLPEEAARARCAYLRLQAPILYGKPSYLLELRSALIAAGDAMAPWSPALVLVSGESLYGDDRRRLETFFRAPLMDALASTEGGLIAVKAAESDVYRVVGENVWLEIIDRDGAVRDTGEGELVLTNLVYRHMVFLRYRTGDVADLYTDADSGDQSLLRLRGREPATLTFGSQSLQTDRVTQAFEGMPGLGDFRLTATPDGAVLLRWSPEPHQEIDRDAVTAALLGHVETWLPGHAVAIECAEVLTAKGGKKRRFVQAPLIEHFSTHEGFPRHDAT
jgi:phenylacetate-coenzyme A ligase PaaK-like adenylate-forming protein